MMLLDKVDKAVELAQREFLECAEPRTKPIMLTTEGERDVWIRAP